MARHRMDESVPAVPTETEKVQPLPAGEGASPRRLWRYGFAAAVAAAILISSTAWVLKRGAYPVLMLTPAATASASGDQAVEGFGQVQPRPSSSPSPGASLSPRPSLRASESTAPQAPAPAAAVAHYQFDEASGTAASDASGNGRTAALAGGALFGPGRQGNGVDLSGSSQYVALPGGILSGATDFTVSAWVRLDSVTTWSRVFDFGSSTSVNMFLTARSGAGTARFVITTSGNGSEQRINAPAPLPSGTWTHVAVTLSGSVGILYVNRAEVARTTGITLTPASLGATANNWIGRSQYPADPYLDGIVDDMRIYSRGLSESEIAALP